MSSKKLSENTSLSVIIPVFRSGNNIKRCIESAISQSEENLEILLVKNNDSESTKLCENYSKKDNRIKVLGSNSHTISNALNIGLDNASGDYIGFLWDNGWAEEAMYKTLVNIASRYSTDVVESLYHYHRNGSEPEMVNNLFNSNNSQNFFRLFNAKISDKFLVPDFYLKRISICNAIYKKEFLDGFKIRFEFDSSDYRHLSEYFGLMVYIHMKDLYVYKGALYNLRCDDVSSNNQTFQYALDTISLHLEINEHLEKLNIETSYRQMEFAKLYKDAYSCYKKNCNTTGQRFNFINLLSSVLKRYINMLDKNIFLTNQEKNQINKIVSHPAAFSLLDKKNLYIRFLLLFAEINIGEKVKQIRILRFPLVFIKTTYEYSTFNICKIPVLRKKCSRTGPYNAVTRYYSFYLRMAKVVEDINFIRFYFLNINLFRKINILAKLNYLTERVNRLPSNTDIVYYSGMTNTVTAAHNKIFPQFKNSNKGKSVVILGSGPTLNCAPLIESSKIIACNRTIDSLGDREPDYIFAHDYPAIRDFIEKIINRNCPVFLGNFISSDRYDSITAPETFRINDNVYSYYSGVGFQKSIRTELEYYPLATFSNIVDCALHFALYTNPSIIYLIGCDASHQGYADKNLFQFAFGVEVMIQGHRCFKAFKDIHYPDTRIISINPVGLKGIYEDVYTKKYLDENAYIDPEAVNIVDKI